jgi:hypothetical protein
VRLLDTSGSSGRGLSGGLGGELLSGSLSSGRLSGGLLEQATKRARKEVSMTRASLARREGREVVGGGEGEG